MDKAYRGYLIRISPFRDDVWVEKDGHCIIASAIDHAQARFLIDTLLHIESPA